MLFISWMVRAVPLIVLTAPVSSADASRPWGPDAFLPVTETRIAALPAGEQGAWRAYWENSVAHANRVKGGRDVVDHSPLHRLDGPPIPSLHSEGLRLDAAPAWYATEEARTIADHVANWQTATGGWVKTGDYARERRPEDDDHDAWSAGTYDNNSTIHELRFLAQVITAADDSPRARTWRASFERGLDYVFASQFPNGGFPQIYPLVGGYHDAITYNDEVVVQLLRLLRDIGERRPEFSFLPGALAGEARQRLARGIRCLLDTQLRSADGQRTVWGQQHDALTLRACAARNFEPLAEVSTESVAIVAFLMSIPDPSPEIVAAVDGAMRWFSRTAIRGVVWDRDRTAGTGLVPREGAPDLWARFYEMGTGKPIFSERDRMIHYTVTELTHERRHGYSWYTSRPVELRAAYATWRQQHGRSDG